MPLWQSVPLRGVLFAAGGAATLLPRPLELRLGRALGRLALRFGLFKSKVAEENIRRCLRGRDAAARRRILERNFEHYGQLFFEYLHFFSPLPGHYRRYMAANSVVEGRENWEKANARGKGVLFAACHLGCWEMLAAGGAMSGIPLTVVTTVLKPPWLDAIITERRLRTEVRAATHPGAMPAVLRALRRGESVAFMNDQYAPPPMGEPVYFFGIAVDTLAAVGPLAARTGAAVVPAYTYRDEEGRSHVVIEPEMTPEELAQGAATQAISAKIEWWIRRRPEQWLWVHRRFKGAAALA
jgi:KDO2-lipid IV(A) lauroyltransferase